MKGETTVAWTSNCEADPACFLFELDPTELATNFGNESRDSSRSYCPLSFIGFFFVAHEFNVVKGWNGSRLLRVG